MSAYICNPEHIGLLAAYAVARDNAINEWRVSDSKGRDDKPATAANVAKQLLLANIRSVQVRYPDEKPGSLPGPCLDLDDQILAVQAYARHYLPQIARRHLGTVDIIKAAAGYDYQACEPEDWETTLAARQVRWIVSAAHRQLPGYEESEAWTWTEEHSLESVDALYHKAT